MPVSFWGDADGSRYRSAYFEAFEGEEVWAHGDYVKVKFELLTALVGEVVLSVYNMNPTLGKRIIAVGSQRLRCVTKPLEKQCSKGGSA